VSDEVIAGLEQVAKLPALRLEVDVLEPPIRRVPASDGHDER
jgi:hypothetical protein